MHAASIGWAVYLPGCLAVKAGESTACGCSASSVDRLHALLSKDDPDSRTSS